MTSQLPSLTFVLNKINTLMLNDVDELDSEFAHEQMKSLADSLTESHFIFYLLPVFGTDIPLKAYRALYQSLQNDSLENPPIEIVEPAELSGHSAAYNSKKDIIEVSKEVLDEALDSDEGCWKLLSVLVEEYGHYIDDILRNKYSNIGGDASHDEGAILAYDLIRLDFKGTESAEFAEANTDEFSGALNVDFSDMHTSLNEWLGSKEQVIDDKDSEREFFGDGMNHHEDEETSFGHESIELILLQVPFTDIERKQIYFGNWLRDYSQLVDPAIVRKAEDAMNKDYEKIATDSFQVLEEGASNVSPDKTVVEALDKLKVSLEQHQPVQGVRYQTNKVRALLNPEGDTIAKGMLDKIDRFSENPEQKEAVIGKVIDSVSDYVEDTGANTREAVSESMQAVKEATDQVFTQQRLEQDVDTAARYLAEGGKAADPAFSPIVKRIKKELDPYIQAKEAQKQWKEFEPEKISIADATDIEIKVQRDESILLSREAITKAIDIMAIKEFGSQEHFRVSEDILGLYRPEEHMDNPLPEGDPESWEDPSEVDPDFAPPPTTGGEVESYLQNNTEAKTVYSFDFNSTSAEITLDKALIDILAQNGGQTILLEGHTDSIGSESANQVLSLQRAEKAKALLLSRLGSEYSEDTIKTIGFGETRPIATNDTEEGRAKNRRVEVIFQKHAQMGINPITGLKNYIATPTPGQSFPTAVEYMTEQLQLAVQRGRTPEGLRHFGQALHVLEDYFAHSNFVEVSLIKLGHQYDDESLKKVLPWVDPSEEEKQALGGRWPIVTGRFGRLDVLASVGPKIATALFPIELEEIEFLEVGERTPSQKAALTILEDLAKAQREHGKGNAQAWLEMYQEALDKQDVIYAYTKDVSDWTKKMIHNTLKRAMVFANMPIHYILSTLAFNIDDVQTLTEEIGTNPTHSQLAKDHDTHHFHPIAAELAQQAVLKTGVAMANAWAGKVTDADPIATAQSYIVHPESTDWMDDRLYEWAKQNPAAIERAATDTWVNEAHEHYESFKDMAGHASEKAMKRILSTYSALVEMLDDEKTTDTP